MNFTINQGIVGIGDLLKNGWNFYHIGIYANNMEEQNIYISYIDSFFQVFYCHGIIDSCIDNINLNALDIHRFVNIGSEISYLKINLKWQRRMGESRGTRNNR